MTWACYRMTACVICEPQPSLRLGIAGFRLQCELWRRHPRGVILIRVLVTAWLLALTGILLAYGYWGWGLVTLTGAVANILWAYGVYRATMR